jgi:hypothetical protein
MEGVLFGVTGDVDGPGGRWVVFRVLVKLGALQRRQSWSLMSVICTKIKLPVLVSITIGPEIHGLNELHCKMISFEFIRTF